MTLVYEAKAEDWARTPKNCNTNNHESDMSVDEYKRRISQTNKNVWVRSFPDPPGTITIPISVARCKILSEASKIGFITNARSSLFKEELDEIESYINTFVPSDVIGRWFIRLNEASPKDGKYGVGPLLSAKEMVTSLVTSVRAHRSFETSIKMNVSDILYLVPWRQDWNEFLEFRVFVHERKVTCLSQYVWCRNLGWNQNNITIVAPRILDYCNTTVLSKFDLNSFVVDIIVVIKDPIITDEKHIPLITKDIVFDIEVVEFNSFGSELASGAALFHWLNDHDVMYSDGTSVVVRYVE